jgi:U3 small nucleolar RNA-associated protein 4
MAVLKVHRCRFVHFIPSNILQISSFQKKFAILRENGLIEVFCLYPQLYTLLTIPAENTEQIILLKNTIITATLSGQVTIYSLTTGLAIKTFHSTGGAIWALKLNPDSTLLALGTESGQIHLLTPDLEYLSTLTLQSSTRITCLSFHPSKPIIAAGSIDGKIRILHLDTHSVIQNLILTRTNTIIWSLLFLTNGTLVSGDSLGNVIFWNTKTSTIIQKFSHQADVLSLTCLNNTIISSSIDRQIQGYVYTKSYIQTIKRKFHSHDIRSISPCSDKLISGGIGQTIISSLTTKSLVRFGMVPSLSILAFARGLVTDRQDDGVRVYKINQGYKHLFTILVNQPLGHDISRDGNVVVVFNRDGLRVFGIGYEDSNVDLIKKVDVAHVWVCKIFDDKVVLGLSGRIMVLEIDGDVCKEISLGTKSMVTRLAISDDGICVCGDIEGNLVSVDLDSMELGLPLPKYNMTSIQFMPSSTDLVITTVSNEIYILDVKTNTLHPWSSRNSSNIPQRFLDRGDIIKGVTFTSTGMIIYGYSFLYHINLQIDIEQKWILETRYQAIMDVRVDGDEMVVVERPVLQVLSEIGGAVGKKKYGE